ncbi:jg16515 [Pararge aegeria aegeria]|uniref:Jg16515 protein n=1 Tax=Pararge aegeria aegeria TaxID=348720 RepID=A0A8S4QRN9_9NEOP|nr:jg16515 [Pararge aegeria aegeria]
MLWSIYKQTNRCSREEHRGHGGLRRPGSDVRPNQPSIWNSLSLIPAPFTHDKLLIGMELIKKRRYKWDTAADPQPRIYIDKCNAAIVRRCRSDIKPTP